MFKLKYVGVKVERLISQEFTEFPFPCSTFDALKSGVVVVVVVELSEFGCCNFGLTRY